MRSDTPSNPCCSILTARLTMHLLLVNAQKWGVHGGCACVYWPPPVLELLGTFQ